MTKSPHPHEITGDCPVPCLTGIVPERAVTALSRMLGDEGSPHGTIAGIVKLQAAGRLADVRGIGSKAVAQIKQSLAEAGLIESNANTQFRL